MQAVDGKSAARPGNGPGGTRSVAPANRGREIARPGLCVRINQDADHFRKLDSWLSAQCHPMPVQGRIANLDREAVDKVSFAGFIRKRDLRRVRPFFGIGMAAGNLQAGAGARAGDRPAGRSVIAPVNAGRVLRGVLVARRIKDGHDALKCGEGAEEAFGLAEFAEVEFAADDDVNLGMPSESKMLPPTPLLAMDQYEPPESPEAEGDDPEPEVPPESMEAVDEDSAESPLPDEPEGGLLSGTESRASGS